MSRPVFLNHGISARERYDGVAANLFEIENERDFELFKKQCLTFVKARNFFKLKELISKWKKNKKGVSMNFQDPESGDTPLMMAASQNNKQILQLVLDQDVDLTLRNKERKTAVHIASEDLQTIMLSGKIDTDLKHAAWLGNVSAVKTMLRKEKNINERNSEGMTPLLLATRDVNFLEKLPQMKDYNPQKVVKTLLEHNADISMYDFDGRTVIHHLVENTGLAARQMAKTLLYKAKRLDAVDRKERTPLHTAAKLGDAMIVEMLLASGSNVSSRSSDGKTPLHYSVISGSEEVTRLLVKWNANINATDDKGKTPWDFAKEQKNEKLLNVLRQSHFKLSEENGDDGDSSLKSESSSIIYKAAETNLPISSPPFKPIRNESTPLNMKTSNKSQPFKLPNLEFHARPSISSPVPSSHRAKSAKKTASLPSSFKFEDKTQSYLEEDCAYSKKRNSVLDNPISENNNLELNEDERLTVSLDSKLNSSSSGNVFQEEGSSTETSEIQTCSPEAIIGRKGSLLPRVGLAANKWHMRTRTGNDWSCKDKQNVDVRQEPISDDQTKNIVSCEEYCQGNIFSDEDSVRNSDSTPSLKRQQKQSKKRILSANAVTSKFPRTDGKVGRCLPELNVASADSKDIFSVNFADCKRNSEADATISDLKNTSLAMQNTLLQGGERDCIISVIRGQRSRYDIVSPFALAAPLSDMDLTESQYDGSIILDTNSAQIVGGENTYTAPSHEKLKVPCEKFSESLSTTRSKEVGEKNESTSDKECGMPDESNFNVHSFGKGAPFRSLPVKKMERAESISKCNLLPSMETQMNINPSKKLMNRSSSPNVKAANHQRKASGLLRKRPDGGTKKVTEAKVIHVSLPQIKSTLLGQSRGKRLPFEGLDEASKQGNQGKEMEARRGSKNTTRNNEKNPILEDIPKENAFVGIMDSSSSSFSVSLPLNPNFLPSTTMHTHSRLPQEDSDLPTRCSHSPPSSIHSFKSTNVNVDESISCLDSSFKRQIQMQLSVVEESSYEVGPEADDGKHDVKDSKTNLDSSIDSFPDSSLSLSVTIPIESTTDRNEVYDLEDRESVRLAEDLKKITSRQRHEPFENIDSCAEQVRSSSEISSSDAYFKELTEIAFAPGINSAISNVPSQRISRRSSLVRSSVCTQTSFDGSDCSEDELHGWRKGSVIDKGANGTVYRGMTNGGKLVAVKEVELNKSDKMKAETTYGKLQEEIEMLKSLTHRYIVKFIGTMMQDNVVDIFMEYIPGGSLALALKQFGPFSEKVFRRFTRQILSAVSYIHLNGIVHRDIKGANIMLTSGGVVKLIDFGCAKRMKRSLGSKLDLLRSCEGTPYWMAPEVIRGIAYGAESDVWSVGCTVFEMATGNPPWTGNEYAAMYAIGSKVSPIPELPSQFSQDSRDFVASCLIRDQRQRATAKQLVKHRFLKAQKAINKSSNCK